MKILDSTGTRNFNPSFSYTDCTIPAHDDYDKDDDDDDDDDDGINDIVTEKVIMRAFFS
jgi:hypothetical protein